jgi:hypothetical protein
VLIGDVGVKAEARIGAIAGIDVPGGVPAPRRAEELPVGGGRGAVAPDAGDRQGVVRIDDAGKCRLVGVALYLMQRLANKVQFYSTLFATV